MRAARRPGLGCTAALRRLACNVSDLQYLMPAHTPQGKGKAIGRCAGATTDDEGRQRRRLSQQCLRPLVPMQAPQLTTLESLAPLATTEMVKPLPQDDWGVPLRLMQSHPRLGELQHTP